MIDPKFLYPTEMVYMSLGDRVLKALLRAERAGLLKEVLYSLRPHYLLDTELLIHVDQLGKMVDRLPGDNYRELRELLWTKWRAALPPRPD